MIRIPVSHVLLVEDNPVDRLLAQRMLAMGSVGAAIEVSVAASLADAVAVAATGNVDVVLLDLNLPDSSGLQTFSQFTAAAPHLPVVLLTGTDDETLALEAVRLGAQDYLVKGGLTPALIQRALRYAVERSRLHQELRALSLVDELTGLHNLRGFQTLAAEDFRLASRRGTGLVVGFADLDGLKEINDTWGHSAGDTAIRAAAEVLTRAFRRTDLVARVGGDEFAVLIRDADVDSIGLVAARLAEQVAAANTSDPRPWVLAMSSGFVFRPPRSTGSLDELLAEADQLMYADKMARYAQASRPSNRHSKTA